MVLRSPPITEYVAPIEQVCSKLQQGEAEELRGEVKSIIKKTHNPPNITKEEMKAIRELKEDSSRMVLTADKGVPLVVMDTADYKKKQMIYYNSQHTNQFQLTPPLNTRTNLLICWNPSRQKGVSVRLFTRSCIQLEQDPQSSMACPSYIKKGCQ